MQLLLVFFVAAATLFASPLTHVTLTNAGSPVLNDGIRDVGPYTIEIEGRTVPALCIDLLDQMHVGDEWTAFLSPLEGGLGHTYLPEDRFTYEEEAYLYTQIVLPNADRIGLQHAAWSLTDPAFAPDTNASRWLLDATQHVGAIDLQNFRIISAMPIYGKERPQEYIAEIPIPEPYWLYLVMGLTVVLLVLVSRR